MISSNTDSDSNVERISHDEERGPAKVLRNAVSIVLGHDQNDGDGFVPLTSNELLSLKRKKTEQNNPFEYRAARKKST